MTIAVAQFAPIADVAANAHMIAKAARAAAAGGARLLVTPEYSSFFTAELGRAFADAAEPLDGPFVSGLIALAEELDIAIIAGMSESVPGRGSVRDGEPVAGGESRGKSGRGVMFRNTLVAVLPDGTLALTYRKVHLYDAFGSRESDWIEAGDPAQLPVFVLDGVRIGLETCYDLRFPEVTRRLAAAEADVVLVPAEWVHGPGKEHHWRTLLTARAIENTVFVVGAGQTPPVGIGSSVVLDPSGVALAALGAEPGLLMATLSTAAIERVRAVNPSLSLRRYDITQR